MWFLYTLYSIQQVFQNCFCSLDIHVFCFSLFLLKTKDLNESEKKKMSKRNWTITIRSSVWNKNINNCQISHLFPIHHMELKTKPSTTTKTAPGTIKKTQQNYQVCLIALYSYRPAIWVVSALPNILSRALLPPL